MSNPRIEVDTAFGKLFAEVSGDPTYPGIHICIEQVDDDGSKYEKQLALAECTPGVSPKEDGHALRLMVWNSDDDDYTDDFTIMEEWPDKEPVKEKCPGCIEEQGKPYPLCVNNGCQDSSNCCLSAHMSENPEPESDDSEFHRCSCCGADIEWGGRDGQKGTIWCCDECGSYFCEECFRTQHGAEALHDMVDMDGDGVPHDPFLRKDSFEGQPWYNEFGIFCAIGVCEVPDAHVEEIREALARFLYATRVAPSKKLGFTCVIGNGAIEPGDLGGKNDSILCPSCYSKAKEGAK